MTSCVSFPCCLGQLSCLNPGLAHVPLAEDCSWICQVLVPCYTEPIEIVAETVWAAHQASLPAGCSATVWLLDDGKDEDKAAWVSGLATPTIRYISGRQRPSGMHDGFTRLYVLSSWKAMPVTTVLTLAASKLVPQVPFNPNPFAPFHRRFPLLWSGCQRPDGTHPALSDTLITLSPHTALTPSLASLAAAPI
jgi:hypothetical protein